MSIEEVMKEACDKLREHGVESYVVCVNDPDSDRFNIRWHGQSLWCVGIADLAKDIIKKDMDKRAKES